MSRLLFWVARGIKRIALKRSSRSPKRAEQERNVLALEYLEDRFLPAFGMTGISISGSGPLVNLVVGSDGNLWTGGMFGPATIDRVTPDGQVTKYEIPDGNSLDSWLHDLTRGGDGNL